MNEPSVDKKIVFARVHLRVAARLITLSKSKRWQQADLIAKIIEEYVWSHGPVDVKNEAEWVEEQRRIAIEKRMAKRRALKKTSKKTTRKEGCLS